MSGRDETGEIIGKDAEDAKAAKNERCGGKAGAKRTTGRR
jgi:hypothetical protein